ncbi:MAG: hypothetical protein QHH75_11410 [Bacillota bacterium]|nr:hypothetical protein [Bacillota bacterium]
MIKLLRKPGVLLLLTVFILTCLALAGCAMSPVDLLKGRGKAKTGQPAGGVPAPGGTKRSLSLQALVDHGMDVMKRGVSFDYIVTGSSGTMTAKMWVQGYKFKFDGTFGGEKMVSIADLEKKEFITYYPTQNKAVKLAADSPEIKAEPPTRYIKMIDYSKAQVLGTELCNGASCRVVLLPGENGGQTKMWLREDCGLPVKVEATATGGGVTVTEYRNLKFGLPPGTFELPPGVEVVDINKMLEQLQ